MALGVSVGYAYEINGLTNGSSQITVSSDASTASGKELVVKQDSSNGNYDIFTNDNSTPIENLRFWFGASDSDITSGQAIYKINGSGTASELSVLQINNTNTVFSSTNGLKMGANGTGTLKISANSADNRTFTLNLISGTSSTNYALYGNLELEGGSGTVNATFGGKGISGNIILKGGTSNITFTGNAKLEGNINTTGGTLNFKGAGAIVGGDLIATSGTTHINTNSLTVNGSINSNGGDNYIDSNAITINGLIKTNVDSNYHFKNVITTQTLALNGDIEAKHGHTYVYASNSATLKNISTQNNWRWGGGVSYLVFDGSSLNVGSDSNKANITVDMSDGGGNISNAYGHSVIVANTLNNTLKLDTMSLTGSYGGGQESKIHSIITFNKDKATNTLSANSISSGFGNTIIGKNIANSSGYSSTLFDSTDTRDPSVKSNFTNLILTDTYMADVSFNLGSGGDVLVASQGGNNYINTKTLSITGNATATRGANYIRTQNFSINGSFTSTLGVNYVYASTSSTLGSITAENIAGADGGINYFVLEGATASIGTDSAKADITVTMNKGTSVDTYGHNTIVLNATTNTLKLDSVSLVGFSGVNQGSKIFNIFSFNNDNATNTLSVSSVSTSNGNTIIGTDIADKSGHNSALFTTTNAKYPVIKGDFSTTFMTDTYMAKGTYTFGSGSGDAIIAGGGGTNYINVTNLAVNGSLTASGGTNNIRANQFSANSVIASAGTNTITLLGSGTKTILGNITANSGGQSQTPLNVITSSNGLTFGNGADISITAKDVDLYQSSGRNHIEVTGVANFASNASIVSSLIVNGYPSPEGHNILKFNDNVTFASGKKITELSSAVFDTGKNRSKVYNILSFESSTQSTVIIDDINLASTLNGNSSANNYIGKGYTTGSGSALALNANLFNSTGVDSKFWNDATHQANVNLTITNTLNAKGGSNYINVASLTAGSITSTNSGSNNLALNSGVVNGNISGTTNIDLIADNATLTLKGANSSITKLTALLGATNGNTLTLDASTNDTVNATIATVTNGNKLNVNFKGINEANSTKLTLDTGTNTALRLVTAESGINNTLKLSGTNTMSIAEAVTIGGATGDKKGVIFDLSSGSSLTFSKNLTTNAQGIVSFNLGGASNTITGTLTNSGVNNFNFVNNASLDLATGLTTNANAVTNFNLNGSNTIAGTLTNNGIHNFNLDTGTTTTFKYGASGLAFSSGENNINFNVDGMGLNWQQSNGTTVTNITTSGGTTNLNFINTGTINSSGLSTTAGITNINIYNGKTATLGGAIATSTGAQTNVIFKGAEGATTRGVPTYSILNISGASNKITSVTSNTNAKIAIGANEGAEIDNITIGNGASLVFAFTGSGASTVTATNGITVGNGATLGISLSGDGEKKVVAGGSAKITLGEGSTLLIDFQAGNSATGIIGDGAPFTISEGSNSIVNFWGANTGSLNASGNNSVTIDGGNNTVNFYGSATFGGIAFGTKGGTNTINVVDDDNGITGTVAVADISKSAVTNIINLGKNATLTLTSANTTLTSSSTGNELNFIGDSATFQGGFGVSGNGKATINVGMISANPTDTIPPVSGIITGAVTGADLKFNAGESTLTLQGQTNTFTSLTSGASDGILYLDASTSNVSAEIGSSFAIGSGKSLTFALVSGGNTAGATTNGGEASVSVNGAITVGTGGTLGIAIGGNNKNGQRSVTASGGITFQGGSTLRVDFLANSEGTASLGTGKDGFVITGGNKSVINFYAGSSATLDGGLTIDGGDNTVNFQGSAQLRDIKLISGTNTINVLGASTEASKITATLISDSLGGNKFSNTVNLEKFAVLNLKADKELATENGSGSIKALVNVNDESTVIQGNLLDGSSIAFTKKAGGLTLKGATNSGATNTLTTISTVDGATNTLTLDTTGGNNETTVSGVLNAQNLTINLAGTDASNNKATLTLNGGDLGEISVTNSANTLALNGRETSINTFALASNAVLNIEFNGGGLNAVNGIAKDTNKTFNLSAKTGNSYVSGGVIDANTLDIAQNSSLAIRNATATFATVSGSGTLTLDGAGAGANVEVIATSVSGSNITANFNGNATGGNTLVLSDTTTLADITFGANSTNNTISVASGKTLTVANTEGVTVGSGNAITFSLANTSTLNLAGGMTSAGTSTISVDSTGGENRATLSGGDIKVSNVNLSRSSGTDASSLTLTATSTDIATLTASAGGSNTLIIDGASRLSGNTSATLHTIDGILNVEMKGASDKVATLNLNGGSIASVSATSGGASENIINFKSGTTTIIGAIDNRAVGNDLGLTLNLNGGNLILDKAIDTTLGSGTGVVNVAANNATLQLKGETNKIGSLSGNGVVDLAVADSNGNPLTRSVKARSGFKTLTIADYKDGNNTFNVYVNSQAQGAKADQIEVTSGTGNATFTVMGNIDNILGITYNSQKPSDPNNVQVASGMTNIEVSGGDSLIGYDIIQAQVIKDGGNVYLGQAISKGVAQEIKDVASSALTVNYDLFLANFNSLNKRMGELRDNPYSQGVWTRVFGGAMSNDFGAGSKTEYVTAQAGYDYSLTLGDARNYMGIAVAYGHSTTKSNALNIQASQGGTIALQDVKSNMVEVGIYNSYVMDSGWYNDTIFKFDYIMSSFTMTDNLSLESETNNFAMVLSDEFGYRYKFAENEKGNWYIDPQVEVAFGYFNQSDFNRAMLATNSTLEASQDNILTLRTRAGLSLGKKFNTAKGFASLYVGAFYEYDYINGGDAEVLSKSGIANPLDKLESNGRAIVNIGSNIELTEGVRMYIDVEKSFGDKQRTDMQFNFGARYSFGEKTPTLSYQEQQKKKVAPLKVEDKQEAQESKTEASANTQATSEQEVKQ